jgi:hypothetical protein
MLPAETAFKLIPLGYLAFAILDVLLIWLMVRLGIAGAKEGFRFGFVLGAFIWIALAVGLASISTAPYRLLAGWAAGQAIELGLAGAVVGKGFSAGTLKKLGLQVTLLFILCIILAVVLQNIL